MMIVGLLIYGCGLLAGVFGVASVWVAVRRRKRYPHENQVGTFFIGLLLIAAGIGLCEVAFA